jgi:hypothetical protein
MSGVLREASETAARERVRLVAGSWHTRLLLKLRFLGSEDAARSGLRYQPVAWSAIALVAVAFFFPGRPESPTTPAAFVPAPFTPATPPTTLAAPAVAPSTVPLPAAFSAPPATSFVPPATTTTTTSIIPDPVALVVRGFGWGSSLSGVPNNGVPDGTMPVAKRLGNLDKASFIRLSGTATVLTLLEDTAGAREAIGDGLVVACAITDAGWEEKPDQALADAPSWDANACVTGIERDDTWTFDFSAFDDRAGQAGFALVPAPGAPADFQLTFAAS